MKVYVVYFTSNDNNGILGVHDSFEKAQFMKNKFSEFFTQKNMYSVYIKEEDLR